MHRFVWDLRYPKPPVLRHNYTIAAVFGEDTPALPLGPQVLPGEYQVRLTVAGRTYTQPLTVKMDPRVTTPSADLARQIDLEMKISDALTHGYAALMEARNLWKQIEAVGKQLNEDPRAKEALSALQEFEKRLSAVESRESSSRNANTGLSRLNASLATLMEVVDTADRGPTEQAQQAFRELRLMLDNRLALWKEIREKDLPALNELLRKNKMNEISRETK